MPSLRELAVLRAVTLSRKGATFRIDEADLASCVSSGWLTREGKLTAAGEKVLHEETAGED
jgi:hypothetical protein